MTTTHSHSTPPPPPGAAPLSATDQHKQVAHNEATAQQTDVKTAFLADGIAVANLYPHDGSPAHNDNNPGLLIKEWDPSSAGLPTDGGVFVYPDIDTGVKALHTFIKKILANPPAPAPGTPAPAGMKPPSPPFTPDMTIEDFARGYQPSRSEDWVKKFTDYTGVASDSKLSEVAA